MSNEMIAEQLRQLRLMREIFDMCGAWQVVMKIDDLIELIIGENV